MSDNPFFDNYVAMLMAAFVMVSYWQMAPRTRHVTKLRLVVDHGELLKDPIPYTRVTLT